MCDLSSFSVEIAQHRAMYQIAQKRVVDKLRLSESGMFALADPENGVHLPQASSVQVKTGELQVHILKSR